MRDRAEDRGVAAGEIAGVRTEGCASVVEHLLECDGDTGVDVDANRARGAVARGVKSEPGGLLLGRRGVVRLDAPRLSLAYKRYKRKGSSWEMGGETYQRRERVPVQACVSERLEVVELEGVRFRPRHAVDERRAAETLAGADLHALAATLGLGDGVESPVDCALVVSCNATKRLAKPI